MGLFTGVFYYLVVLPLSLLPMRLLYLFSDLLYLLVFHGLTYRKKVVLTNLEKSFPEKSKDERIAIASRFYRHFCDLLVESLKAFTISNEQVLTRLVIRNPEVANRYYEEGRDIVLVGGHYNNWEWVAVGISQQLKHESIAIYKPLSNRFFDEKARKTRGKFGLRMLPMRDVSSLFTPSPSGRRPRAVIFAIDQSPGSPSKAHWMRFMNQDTGVPFGAEKYAREHDLPVIYGVVNKTRRGHYEIWFTEVTDCPRDLPHGAIIEKTTAMLEADIRRAPEYWLWSHRRWKHQRPADAKSFAREI